MIKVFGTCKKCNQEHLIADGLCLDCVRLYNEAIVTKTKMAKEKIRNAEVNILLAEGYMADYNPYLCRIKNIRKKIQTLIKLLDSTIQKQDRVKKNEQRRM